MDGRKTHPFQRSVLDYARLAVIVVRLNEQLFSIPGTLPVQFPLYIDPRTGKLCQSREEVEVPGSALTPCLWTIFAMVPS